MTAQFEFLEPADALYLRLESPRTPMNVGVVSVFEGAPFMDRHGLLQLGAIRAHIEQRASVVPKLRRRVRFPFFGETSPAWVDDPDFDITHHVLHAALPQPGTDDQLLLWSSQLFESPLDRERPLWELWFVEGLEAGRVAIVEKCHHALADSLSAVELLTVLLDIERRVQRHEDAGAVIPEANGGPCVGSVLAGDLLRRAQVGVRAGVRSLDAVAHPARSVRQAVGIAGALSSLMKPKAVLLHGGGHIGGGHTGGVGTGRVGTGGVSTGGVSTGGIRRRSLKLVRLPLEPFRSVERRYGVTTREILLAVVGGGLADELADQQREGVIPALESFVHVGGELHCDHELGNRDPGAVMRLPVGRCGLQERLAEISREVTRCTEQRHAAAGELVAEWVGALPQSLLALATGLIQRQRFVDMTFSLVSGPVEPMYAMGARMLEAFAVIPLVANLELGVAALSYAGQLSIALVTTDDSCTHLDSLGQGIRRSFDELIALAAPSVRSRTSRGGPRSGVLATPPARRTPRSPKARAKREWVCFSQSHR